jgi:hypothetical protein
MKTLLEQEVKPLNCRLSGCPCCLPLGERFVLWAIRQWQHESALPQEGSPLQRGFTTAGLLDALPDFAIAMDALIFGARRVFQIRAPDGARLTLDEATLIALCGLAQSDHDGPLGASLGKLMAPAASRVAAVRVKAFGRALAGAGLHLSPAAGEPGARLN